MLQKFSREQVINLIECLLQRPDDLLDAVNNEHTIMDAEELLKTAEGDLQLLNVLPSNTDTRDGYYQPLFTYLSNEHNAILLDSELGDVVSIVKDMLGLPKYGERPNSFDVFARMNKKDAKLNTQTLLVGVDVQRANAGKVNGEVTMGVPAFVVVDALANNGKFVLLYYVQDNYDAAAEDIVQGRQI